jgi:hypothetical protein
MSAAALLVLAAVGGAGCGYHVGGHGDLLPKSIRTIAVPAFGNNTTQYKLAEYLPADITREFITRTRYSVVADARQADAVLTGTIVSFVSYPTTTDPVSGRATAAQVVVTLRLTLTERASGKVLFSQPAMEFRERHEISVDPKAYFDESGTAMVRLSQSVARSTVTAILENF